MEHLYNTPTNGCFQLCTISCNLDLSVCTKVRTESAMPLGRPCKEITALTSMDSVGLESDRMEACLSTAIQC
jgi:hypothetical protein